MGGLCDEDILREIAEAINNLEDLCKFQVIIELATYPGPEQVLILFFSELVHDLGYVTIY